MSILSTIMIIFVLMLGCSKAPILKQYTLQTPLIKEVIKSPYKGKILKVIYPQSLKEPISQKMNFSYSNALRGSYQNSQWSHHVSKLFQGTMIEVLHHSKLFGTLITDTTTLKEEYSLETYIFAFEHRLRGEKSQSILSIKMILIDANSGRLVKEQSFAYVEDTPTKDAQGYAKATNTIMQKFAKDLVFWLKS